LVIFAGVTFSLLADDWRDRRNAHAAEGDALRQILVDLEADSAQLRRVVEPLPSHDAHAEWLTSRWNTRMAVDSVQEALRAFQVAYPYQMQRAAFTSLRDGLGLALITDDRLRHAIVKYFEETQVQVNQWVEVHWSEREVLWDVLWPYVQMPPGRNMGSMLPSADLPPRLLVPWQQFSQDYRAYNQLGQVGVSANVAVQAIDRARTENRELRARIQRHS
jgi:hypothetical protein